MLATPCQVIGVAGGEVKAEAIAGALRGRLINVLITDSSAAEQILAEATAEPLGASTTTGDHHYG
ncbi:MAG: sugar-binding domain-containing protein [Chloroflexota bacterium]